MAANVPEVQVRFYHEASIHSSKGHVLPEVGYLGVGPRREVIATARGKPSMLHVQAQPAYALANHEVQSLTIKHTVHGCL